MTSANPDRHGPSALDSMPIQRRLIEAKATAMNVSSDQVVQTIAQILRSQVEVDEEGDYIFEYAGTRLPSLGKDEIVSVVDAINSFEDIDDSAVVTKTSFESLVQFRRSSPAIGIRFGDIQLDDAHSGLSYSLGRPSDPYTVYLCLRVIEANGPNAMRLLRPTIMRNRLAREQGELPSVFEVIRSALRAFTLVIKSSEPRTRTAWKEFADAFFFM